MSADTKFHQGYVCAVVAILVMHENEPLAKELLSCAGKINWSEIQASDREVLARHGLLPEHAT